MQAITDTGVEVLAPPDGNMREGKRRGWEEGVYQQMRDKLSTDRGRELYAQRKITVEPVFGQINTTARSSDSCEEAAPRPYLSGG
jgi:Transposase DDE domain